MNRKVYILILLTIIVMGSCKKNKKTTEPEPAPQQAPAPAPYDYTMTAFPNQTGYQWTYVNVITTTVSIINGTNTSSNSYANSTSYTVTITSDTTLPGSIQGKIWYTCYNNNYYNSYKQVAYFDNASNLFYILPIVAGKGPKGVSFKLPLTKNMNWVNMGLMPQDTCKAGGIEQFFNGDKYYNIINVARGDQTVDRDEFKINDKGIVYNNNIVTTFLGLQVTQQENKRVLATTNF